MLKLINKIIDYIYVPKCGGCNSRMSSSELGLCDKCQKRYLDEKEEYCDFCGMSASICTCVPFNMRINGCIDYKKLIFYKKTAGVSCVRNMLYKIKRSHNLSLIRFFAEELFKIDNGLLPVDPIVTFAPRLPNAVKKYGYDQGKLLAENYAKIGGYKFKTLFRRKMIPRQTQQKLLNYRQRAANVKGAFAICDVEQIYGRNVILIDDVVTSGATLGECISLLYENGAKTVICRSIAHTYRKNKRKND